jgi:hypothetical protein
VPTVDDMTTIHVAAAEPVGGTVLDPKVVGQLLVRRRHEEQHRRVLAVLAYLQGNG